MEYIESSKIKMFPSAYRGNSIGSSGTTINYDVESRLTLEKHLAKFTNWSENLGYVINVSSDLTDVRFNVAGYFFSGDLSSLLTTDEFKNATDIYANITLQKIDGTISTNQQIEMVNLISNDIEKSGSNQILDRHVGDSDIFFGVGFSTTQEATTDQKYNLHIATKEGSNWKAPELSTIMLALNRVGIYDTKNNLAKRLSDCIECVVDDGGQADFLFTVGINAPSGYIDAFGADQIITKTLLITSAEADDASLQIHGNAKISLSKSDTSLQDLPMIGLKIDNTTTDLSGSKFYDSITKDTIPNPSYIKTKLRVDYEKDNVQTLPANDKEFVDSINGSASAAANGTLKLAAVAKTGSATDLLNFDYEYSVDTESDERTMKFNPDIFKVDSTISVSGPIVSEQTLNLQAQNSVYTFANTGKALLQAGGNVTFPTEENAVALNSASGNYKVWDTTTSVYKDLGAFVVDKHPLYEHNLVFESLGDITWKDSSTNYTYYLEKPNIIISFVNNHSAYNGNALYHYMQTRDGQVIVTLNASKVELCKVRAKLGTQTDYRENFALPMYVEFKLRTIEGDTILQIVSNSSFLDAGAVGQVPTVKLIGEDVFVSSEISIDPIGNAFGFVRDNCHEIYGG